MTVVTGVQACALPISTSFVGKQVTVLVDGKPITVQIEGDFARFEVGLIPETPVTITIAK